MRIGDAVVNERLMGNFQKYSYFYDLLYADKDYAAEAEYVARTIRSSLPDARSVLELGSGTGRHGRLLAAMGFDVMGIERSADMVSVAKEAGELSTFTGTGSFTCDIGDICTAKLGRTFDAVISLFHVISYQTTDKALRAAFEVAADHLAPGGVFIFDVWHGPAVLAQRPSRRVKEVADERYRVKRTAHPELDLSRSTVKVTYHMDCEDRQLGEAIRFDEHHLLRYLSLDEVDALAQNCGLRRELSEEFLTGQEPSSSTWSVAYVLRK
jgi:SAM-dependent methyltransferase